MQHERIHHKNGARLVKLLRLKWSKADQFGTTAIWTAAHNANAGNELADDAAKRACSG